MRDGFVSTKYVKPKERYNVYHIVSFHDGMDGSVSRKRTFAGETWAASKEQAENNVRFRNRGKSFSLEISEYSGDSAEYSYYEAIPAREDA